MNHATKLFDVWCWKMGTGPVLVGRFETVSGVRVVRTVSVPGIGDYRTPVEENPLFGFDGQAYPIEEFFGGFDAQARGTQSTNGVSKDEWWTGFFIVCAMKNGDIISKGRDDTCIDRGLGRTGGSGRRVLRAETRPSGTKRLKERRPR